MDGKEEEGERDVRDEEGEEDDNEVDEMGERGGLVGVWQIWYFPKSGHGWGWISGPGIDNNGAIFSRLCWCSFSILNCQENKFEKVPANHCFLESGGKNREGTQASPA